MSYSYPSARKGDTVDNFHGTMVPDPYRWMEDMTLPETRTWLEAEAALTTPFLESIPAREKIKARLTELWNFPRYSTPFKRGNRYFFFKNDGLQNQSVLYVQEGLDGEPKLVIDPNGFSSDGTVALVNFAFSDDGNFIAYARSTSGSDLQEIFVRDVNTGKDLDEVLRWGRFVALAWLPDGSGFYYNRYAEPGTVPESDLYFNNKLYFHRLNTPQTEDTLVYERPDAKELGFAPQVTEDGCFLVLNVWHSAGNKNRLYYRELESNSDFVRLIDEPDALYEVIGNAGDMLYLHTERDAPRGRIVAVDLSRGGVWKDIVPETDDVIAFASIIHNQIVIVYLHDAAHRVAIFNLDGTPDGIFELPVLGSIFEISGRQHDKEMFISFGSFLYPNSILRYDFESRELKSFGKSRVELGQDQYETKQVFAISKDGTRVPIFLTYKKGLKLDGQNPTWLTGYGGYNISNTPAFSAGNFYWIEQGGVLALAVLRGGGEYGEEWHKAGMLGNKQNVFDDFIAGAEWLIGEKYTSPQKLAISGRSNGGLLVAACMLQRPELYGAVLCGVPVTDMLRFAKFTAGRFWVEEYGDAEGQPEHFQFLYAYSPAHTVKAGVTYPPILILTAESDDRVVPMHSLKFTAALQAVTNGANPILLRFEFKAGHGFGKPVSKVIEEIVDMYAFAYRAFGIA